MDMNIVCKFVYITTAAVVMSYHALNIKIMHRIKSWNLITEDSVSFNVFLLEKR
jgi:hypothetical protein